MVRTATKVDPAWFHHGVTHETEVRTWIERRALAELTSTGFAQVDLDELLEQPPARAALVTLNCLQVALTGVRQVHATAAGIEVIPLAAVDDQDSPPTHHQDFAQVFDLDWTYGPGLEVPGLYIARDGHWQADANVEEYRVSVNPPESTTRAYYRAWRTLDEAERFPHEWSRAFYIHIG